MKYNPRIAPDPKQWLQEDELEKIQWIVAYHQRARIQLPDVEAHAILHMIVENQSALGDKTPVAQTLNRLIAEGLDRHEAIHAIGSVFFNVKWDMMHGKKKKISTSYFDEVRKLTAQKWINSDHED